MEIIKSVVAEILIFGIPKASCLRGLIRLVKFVSTLLARAHKLSYGAQIDQTCTNNPNIYLKKVPATAHIRFLLRVLRERANENAPGGSTSTSSGGPPSWNASVPRCKLPQAAPPALPQAVPPEIAQFPHIWNLKSYVSFYGRFTKTKFLIYFWIWRTFLVYFGSIWEIMGLRRQRRY